MRNQTDSFESACLALRGALEDAYGISGAIVSYRQGLRSGGLLRHKSGLFRVCKKAPAKKAACKKAACKK